jgi:hypothetical protein
LERYQRCPRAFYWNYVYKGLGLQQSKRPLPLAFGGSAHLGLEQVLRGAGIERGVEVSLQEFEQQARGIGLLLEPNEDAYSVYQEQRALLEALLRAWYLVRYPSFTDEYEVIDLEREEEWKPSEGITFMARADGLLRSRATGDLYVLSFKTAKQYDKKRVDEARSDIQGISELVAIEERLGERVQGIQMEYLIKGRREEWPKGSGIYQTSSPLIRPWVNADGRYAHSWDWSDLDGRHTLGNKWRKVAIWESLSIADWISQLASGSVQPSAGPCLDRWIVSPLPYYRNRDEVESWKRQAREQAVQIARKVKDEEYHRTASNPSMFVSYLDHEFPQYRHSCNYPTACPFKGICFGSAGSEPETSGQYVEREPHHAAELEPEDA